jgi:hypothetical protein
LPLEIGEGHVDTVFPDHHPVRGFQELHFLFQRLPAPFPKDIITPTCPKDIDDPAYRFLVDGDVVLRFPGLSEQGSGLEGHQIVPFDAGSGQKDDEGDILGI